MTQVLRNLMSELMHPELKYRGPSLIEHIEKCHKRVEEYPKIWNEGKVEVEINKDNYAFWEASWYLGFNNREFYNGKFWNIEFASKDRVLDLNPFKKHYQVLILGENMHTYHPTKFPDGLKTNTKDIEIVGVEDILDSPEAIEMIHNSSELQKYLMLFPTQETTIGFNAVHSKHQKCRENWHELELLTEVASRMDGQTVLYHWGANQFFKEGDKWYKRWVSAVVDARRGEVVAVDYRRKLLEGCPGM